MKNPFISICIPAYNRPDKLYQLLKTIDADNLNEIEVVVSDDFSPRREEIKKTVEQFRKESKYSVVYHENEKNLGYDGNLKETVKAASGKWLVFMGDDDEFIPEKLNKLITFLKEHDEVTYVLRSYEVVHDDGKTEKFRYYSGNKFFEPGEKTYEELFRKSVFISGFTIKREPILPYLVDYFDGAALIQIYWVAELVLNSRAAYFDEPITRHVENKSYRAKELMYDEETGKLVARRADLKRSLNFLSGYIKIAKFMDQKHGFHSTRKIMLDLSKYSYPSLSIHREEGLAVFLEYARGLNKLGFNITPYYYMYVLFLIIFGKKFCDLGIRIIKNILGRTPRL
ncbi:MAG: glycosyltransferase family 2 protein [bacterium]|nr:glycosyltransferase family 2 protein [bacterium]